MRTFGPAVRRAGALAAPLLLAGTLAGLGPVPAQAATAGCQNWTGIQPPSSSVDNSSFNAVAVLSACNAWTVGTAIDASNVQHSLIEHWDGSSWKIIPSPDPGTANNVLLGIRAASPTNIWAVGEYDNGSTATGSADHALILHWNGTAWARQNTPSLGSASGQLFGVRAVSGSEAWAVGQTFAGSTQRSLVLHFTGGKWRQVKIPHFSKADSLSSVAGTSARDMWAVGEASSAAMPNARSRLPGRQPLLRTRPVAPASTFTMQTLILHWNGKTWTRVPSPSPNNDDQLLGVGVGSPSSALAVGLEQRSDGSSRTLAEHWNGKAWTHVSTPGPSSPSARDFLGGVTVISQNNAWAVGTAGSGNQTTSLIERWNGSRWTTVEAPDPGDPTLLFGVAASSASNIWAVGTQAPVPTNQTYVLHCC
jgi:hypothetical protein